MTLDHEHHSSSQPSSTFSLRGDLRTGEGSGPTERINWRLLAVIAALAFFWLEVVPYVATVLIGLLFVIF